MFGVVAGHWIEQEGRSAIYWANPNNPEAVEAKRKKWEADLPGIRQSAWREVEASREIDAFQPLADERRAALQSFPCPECGRRGEELRIQWCQNDTPPLSLCGVWGWVSVCDDCKRVASSSILMIS